MKKLHKKTQYKQNTIQAYGVCDMGGRACWTADMCGCAGGVPLWQSEYAGTSIYYASRDGMSR